MAEAYLKKAQEVVNSAIVLDEKGYSDDARKTYMKALEWFEMAAKYERSQITRVRIQEKMSIYVRRVEVLKAQSELIAMPKSKSLPKYLQTINCTLCFVNRPPGEISNCIVCENLVCSGCMHKCEICKGNVCENDLDRTVVGNICISHKSAKEFHCDIVKQPQLPPHVKQEKVERKEESDEKKEEKSDKESDEKKEEKSDEESDEEKECIICKCSIENPSAIVPCGHFKFCNECIITLKTCPICRSPVTSILKLFG
jgi:hypothetical protein